LREFLKKEIESSSNIKSADTRKAVLSALRKILNNAIEPSPGVAYYSNGDEIVIEQYDGIAKKYHCGKEYLTPPKQDDYDTVLVVIDSYEASIGLTNGNRIKLLWYDTSLVPNKHHMGGQSQMRFNRSRQESLKRWIRKVADALFQFYDNKKIVIGGPGMVKDTLVEELHPYVKSHLVEVKSVGYSNENGLYELMKIERYV
jgi:peptide chain release factor subunit 1